MPLLAGYGRFYLQPSKWVSAASGTYKEYIRILAEIKYILAKTSHQVHTKIKYKSHARSPAIGQTDIVPDFGSKGQGKRGFVYSVWLSTDFGEF